MSSIELSWTAKNLEREEGTNWSNKQTLQHLHLTSWESKSLEREAGVKQTIICNIRILHLGQTNKLGKQTSKQLFASSTSCILRREEPNSRILGQKEAGKANKQPLQHPHLEGRSSSNKGIWQHLHLGEEGEETNRYSNVHICGSMKKQHRWTGDM